MDGVIINNVPDGIKIINFRPDHKTNIGDEHLYYKIVYYNIIDSHHPYKNKHVRDKIMSFIDSD